MNKCKKFKLLIYKKIDKTITPLEESELENHLKNCIDCKQEYEFSNNIIKSLKNEEVPLPANFKSDLHKKLVENNLKTNKKKYSFYKLPIGIAATVCLTLFLTVFTINNTVNDGFNYIINPPTADNTIKKDNINKNIPEKKIDKKDIYSENKKENSVIIESDHINDIHPDNADDSLSIQTRSIPAATKNSDIEKNNNNEENINPTSEAYSLNNDIYLTFNISDENFKSDDFPYLIKETDNYYKSDIKYLEEFKSKIKNFNFEILNENSSGINQEYFVIILK